MGLFPKLSLIPLFAPLTSNNLTVLADFISSALFTALCNGVSPDIS